MLKSIYKITNLINNKSYIGQTLDAERRKKEHFASFALEQNPNNLLYKAINKYGQENFSFEILESNIENYNEREVYWINYYKTKAPFGYNLTDGGDEPPILKGEDNVNCCHSAEDVKDIIKLLSDTFIPTRDIAKMFNYSISAINRINTGKIWRDETLSYPLRIKDSLEFKNNRALQIIEDLQNSTLSQKEIAEKYNVARSTVTAINNGQNNKQAYLEYPIRSKKPSKIILMLDKNSEKILNEFYSESEACQFLNVKRGSIGCCLRGITSSAYGYKWKYKV